MAPKIAVVTGSNKGIGYQLVQDLAAKCGDVVVYLCSRDEKRGAEALAKAQADAGPNGPKIRFHQLDLESQTSIHAFRDFLNKEHGHIDILVNNAGMAFKGDSKEPMGHQATVTNATNYFGTRNVCDALFPLLAPGARVVTVASRMGTVAMKNLSDEKRAAFAGAKSEAEVDKLIADFINLAQSGKHKEAGYADTAYGMSKIGVIALTEVMAKALAGDAKRPDILANSCCPGYVDTDMTNHSGNKSPSEGADTLLYLATLPPANNNNPNGLFVAERRALDWRVGQTMEEAMGSLGLTIKDLAPEVAAESERLAKQTKK